VQTQYYEKHHKKTIGTIFDPQTVDEILSTVRADKKIGKKYTNASQ
jgi:hypothetical protein